MNTENKIIEVLSDQNLDQISGGTRETTSVIGNSQINMIKGVLGGSQKNERSEGFKSSEDMATTF